MSTGSAVAVEQARRLLARRLLLVQFRVWGEQLTVAAVRGLCFGLAVGLGLAAALVAQAGLVEPSALLAAGLLGLGLGALWGLARPPRRVRAARLLDDRFELAERLGTAAELLRRPSGGRFDGSQLVDAANSLRAAKEVWPVPLFVAWREATVALTLAAAILLTIQFEGRGPELLANLPGAPDPASLDTADERQVLPEPASRAAAAERPVSPATGRTAAAMRTLDQLKRARESGALSPEQAQRGLGQVEAELGQEAAAARRQRETLDRLARALGQVSAADSAAESIRRGELDDAREKLGNLGQEADQLSPDAKQQLAQALRRAASESAATNPALADRERRAAEALTRNDYQAQRSALAALGEELARGGGNAASPEELTDALQRLDQERSAAAAAGLAGNGRSSASAGGEPGRSAQPGGSQAGDGEGSGRGGNGGQIAADAGAPASQRQALPEGPAEKAPGAELGAPAPRLDVAGKEVQVDARPSESTQTAGRGQQPSPDEQVVERNDQARESGSASAPVQAGGQSERIVVPSERRQVVRDYFARRGKGSQ